MKQLRMVIVFLDRLHMGNGNESLHMLIRRQVVEHIADNHQMYMPFFLDRYASPEEYVIDMESEGTWAESAAVLATANTFNVEIQILSADSGYVAPITPTESSPSQTIFLGIVDDLHYVSTASINEPQVISYGAKTIDGLPLTYTDCVDCPLTWLSNFYERNELQNFFLSHKDKFSKTFTSFMSKLKGGNSAEAKRYWVKEFSRKKKMKIFLKKRYHFRNTVIFPCLHVH